MRFVMENIAFDPSEYIMDHAILVASMCMGKYPSVPCADPESSVGGGGGGGYNCLFFFVFLHFFKLFILDEWGVDPKTTKSGAILGPRAKRHLNGVSLAGRLWPIIEC